MDNLIQQLAKDFPAFKFTAGQVFSWSPAGQEIIYNPAKAGSNGRWAVLHELGHALLGHTNYSYDFELIKLEVAAWRKAQTIQAHYSLKISVDHIQNCLDTYRDWLYRRSLCPNCGNSSLQQAPTSYQCFNCHAIWKVTAARFCRPYRRTHLSENEKSPEFIKTQATFL